VTLYIAEGYKRSRNSVSIVNSDPAVVKLAAHWMRRFSARAVEYRVTYHADQELEALRSFWAAKLGVEPDSIVGQPKSNSGQLSRRVWRCEHGLLMIRSHDTYFRTRLQAWIDCVKHEWAEASG
jgi:hypothetical protein